MFSVIKSKTPKDKDYPDRYYNLFIYQKILEGTLYDCFPHPYHKEYGGTVMNPEYIEEQNRSPCVNTGLNMMRSVVEESVSFLFGENRFPTFVIEDDQVEQFVKDLVVDAHLVHTMQEAAIKGSIGSVAIQVRVLNDRFFPVVHYTTFLTPEFDPQAPDTLTKITEKKKVRGRDLINAGYNLDESDENKFYWFMRVWDANSETWYVPFEVPVDRKQEQPVPKIDRQRSVEHNLGIVPFVWIRNLPPGPNDVDGNCTFEPAIENCIQIDYAMSRADRALKYNADPLFVVKMRNPNEVADFVKGAGNILSIGVEGDAKVLEISGDAAHAIIDTVAELKDEALHSIHGNRADPDKLATSQSSVAQRMLYLPMVQLASQLRVCYGDFGIVPLVRMMLRIANKQPIKLRGKMASVNNPEVPIDLSFPDFFPSTPFDMQTEAATIVALVTNGVISKETALKHLKKFFEFEGDVEAEMSRIQQDADAQTQLIGEQAKAEADAQPKPVVKTA